MTSEESFVLSLPSVGRGRGRPPASSRWPFAIATEERPLKCNARRQLCPPKRLPRHAPPLQLPAAGGETALKVGGRGGSLQKLSRAFYCVVSPSFLSLLLCAPHRAGGAKCKLAPSFVGGAARYAHARAPLSLPLSHFPITSIFPTVRSLMAFQPELPRPPKRFQLHCKVTQSGSILPRLRRTAIGRRTF